MRKPVFAAALAVCVTTLLPAMAAAQTTLRYSDHEPLGGMRTRFIKEVFFTAIEAESNGRLKIEAHWDSELATGYDALRMVGQGGAADIAVVVPEYAPNDLPLHQIFKSFPTGPTGDAQIAFFRRVYAEIPAFNAELEQANVVNMLFATGFPVGFFSTKPLNSLADIAGGKWRTASFWHRDFMRNAGATPVTMPWGEGVSAALRDGTLDGLMVNIDSGDDIKASQAAPNVLASPKLWLGHIYLLAINKNTWNALAKEDQEAIQRAAQTAYGALGAVMNSSFCTLVAKMQKEGVDIRVLESDELDQWKKISGYCEVQAEWVKQQEEKGVKDAGTVLEKVSKIMNDVSFEN